MSNESPMIGFGTRRMPSAAALLHSARYSGGFCDSDGDPGEYGNAALVQYGLNPTLIVYISVSGRIARTLIPQTIIEENPTAAGLECEA
ncbi:MAG: hypothetical protein HY362_04510 [Candidatus Aenigmarchaeota archaeon]|nr:hypothetical protein [Candidatus Aenigmarchaeota archaeon]